MAIQAEIHNSTEIVPHNRTVYINATIAASAALFAGFQKPPALRDCPFCQTEPDADPHFIGRAVIYCNNDECAARPQVVALTLLGATKLWNANGGGK